MFHWSKRLAVIALVIGNTTTRSGLVVRAKIDRRRYPLGKKIPAKEMRAFNIVQDTFHGDWNYTIHHPSPRGRLRIELEAHVSASAK